jgi:tetratricopeptide (TPR) repeat protein
LRRSNGEACSDGPVRNSCERRNFMTRATRPTSSETTWRPSVEPEFQKALSGAQAAFEAGDRPEALRLYELAVAITPNSPVARAGYERAKNIQSVLRLVDQGLEYEEDLELEAAETSFRQAVTIDPLWLPATEGLARVQKTRTKMEFDQRMSEGLDALAAGDYLSARAAFRMAQQLIQCSRTGGPVSGAG